MDLVSRTQAIQTKLPSRAYFAVVCTVQLARQDLNYKKTHTTGTNHTRGRLAFAPDVFAAHSVSRKLDLPKKKVRCDVSFALYSMTVKEIEQN